MATQTATDLAIEVSGSDMGRRGTKAGENADTRAALPRVWARSLGGQRTTGEKTASRPNTQPGLPSKHHLWKLPRSGPSPLAPPRVGVLYEHHANSNVGAQPLPLAGHTHRPSSSIG